jgi:hypothetical protein
MTSIAVNELSTISIAARFRRDPRERLDCDLGRRCNFIESRGSALVDRADVGVH